MLTDSQILDIQNKALRHGASHRTTADSVVLTSLDWDISGNCLAPKTMELHGRVGGKHKYVYPLIDGKSRSIELTVKCRRCENCLAERSRVWRYRARNEYLTSYRTWIGTMTFSQPELFRFKSSARTRLAVQGDDYDCLRVEERERQLLKEIAPEITKFFKRVRKNSGAKMTYLTVSERHKSGEPHFHCLVHERGTDPVTHRTLSAGWKLGFTNFKLCKSDRDPMYVCKYITKSAVARVRASVGYGDPMRSLTKVTKSEDPDSSNCKRDLLEKLDSLGLAYECCST